MDGRNFIKRAGLTAKMMGVCIPDDVFSMFANDYGRIPLKKDDVLLFQGDSITDANRNREIHAMNTYEALGCGYTLFAAGRLLMQHASKELRIYNKGIGRNNIRHLLARWEEDTLSLTPSVLSVLIGVNDYPSFDGTPISYGNDYRRLIEQTLVRFPSVQLIVGEPYALLSVKYVTPDWFPEFDAYRGAAHQVAEEFNAVFIPYQEVFERAMSIAPGSYWTEDGVHTTMAGAQLMADAWLKVFFNDV